ncbi:MAG: hypothetical protein U0798_07870 [Gemmataceae bacterium]
MTLTRILLTGAASAAGLFAGAQTPPSGPSQYYQGKVSPPQSGVVAQPVWHQSPASMTSGPPASSASKGSGPVVAGPSTADTPSAKPGTIQPVSASDQLPPPLIPATISPPTVSGPAVSGPAVSGPAIVGPSTATPALTGPTANPSASPTITPPGLAVPTMPAPGVPAASTQGPATPTLAPPTVTLETTTAPLTAPSVPAAPINEPRPLTLAAPTTSLASPITSPVTSPVMPPVGTAGAVPIGNLPSKHAPGVVVETIAPDSVSVGQDVTYEIVVKNEGSVAVWNVRIEDEIPTGSKYITSEPAADTANGRLSWGLGSLEIGASKRFRVTIRPSEEGELRNRTVVNFAAATENRMKVTRPKVGIAVAAPESVKAGEEVMFTVKLTNTGSGPATNLVMRATLTDGLHNPNGSVLELKLPSLAAGQVKMVPLRAIATKSGAQNCSLAVHADGCKAEPTKAALTVVEPKLVARVTGPTKCLVKSEPTFLIEFTNPGTASTDSLTAHVAIPAGFEYAQASDGGAVSANGKDVVWHLSGLPAGSGKAVSLKLKSVAPSEASVKVAVSTSNGSDSTPAPAPATASGIQQTSIAMRVLEAKSDLTIRSEGVAALRFEVIDIEDPVEIGKEAIYEIKVTNQGTGPCTNVNITGFTAEGTTAVAANGPTQVRVQAGQLLFDPVAKIDVKGEVVYRVRIKGTQAGDMKFRVQVSCDQIRTPISKEENTRFYKN